MGTITIGIAKHWLNADISQQLSSVIVANPKMTITENRDNKFSKRELYKPQNGYDKHIYGYLDGKFIIVSSHPRPFFRQLLDFRIEFHQSQWKDQQEVVEKFISVFGKHNAKSIFYFGDLHRSDIWLDLGVTYNFMKKCSYRPGVVISDQKKSRLRTYYMGGKKPKLALFYEKEGIPIDDLDLKLKQQFSKSIRVEIRFHQKTPIRRYADYYKLADMNLFRVITTNVLSRKAVEASIQLKPSQKMRVISFLDLVEKEGYHFARQRFNENRNFYRTIEPIVKQTGKCLQLSKRWRRKVRQRIVGNYQIDKVFNMGQFKEH